MIYPSELVSSPESRAEEIVYNKLSQLSDRYDIFYSKRFVKKNQYEKPEYEIDFIITIPNEAILCLEVKGGIVEYDGRSNQWYQNSKPLSVAPDQQATSASHNLINRYRNLSRDVPIDWAVCFPDCEVPSDKELPISLDENRIIDQKSLLFLDKALESFFDSIKKQNPERSGCKYYVYERFKNDLLRGLGFVQRLGTRFKHEEEKFIELAETQLDVFKHVAENDQIIVNGPAGSGKTIVAKELAKELASEEKNVLFLCYNRTLANKISYDTGIRNNELITTGSFHSYTKRLVEKYDAEWWDNQNIKKDDFWELELSAKMEEILEEHSELGKYDALIIDEAQDFKEFWFELLFRRVKDEGKKVIFLDRVQDIFNRDVIIPEQSKFVKFTLPENCRNTKKIVGYLEDIIGESIKVRKNPEGDEVEVYSAKTSVELQTKLVSEIKELTSSHGLSNEQILILINSEKGSSSIDNVKKIGQYDVKSLDNKARVPRDAIAYTTINTFKGLEWDVVFVIDTHLIEADKMKQMLYTQASRARHKLYVYTIENES